ncbi:hypothetical protein ABY44_34390 [Burkholderia sp. ZZQ-2]|uniref:hypothetical protein n=1 Tax=unclassified Burkholderia TaxID=2613784 RepID=UPI003D6E0B13
MQEEDELQSRVDRWLGKLSLMRLARHQEILETNAELHTAEVNKRVQVAKAEGYGEGKDDGDSVGFDRGLEKGREEGQLLERAEQAEAARQREQTEARRRQQEAAERARWLVADKPIGIDERMSSEIRQDVVSCTGQNARDRQWDMILSNHPATTDRLGRIMRVDRGPAFSGATSTEPWQDRRQNGGNPTSKRRRYGTRPSAYLCEFG